MNKNRIIKAALAGVIALCVAALIAAGIKASRGKGIPILMYHHLVQDGEALNAMTVSAGKFESDLKYLKENGYTAILPRDMLEQDFSLPEKPIIISFDDGYRSNYEIAYPLISKYGFKAVISVISAMQDEEREFFCSWDMLREMHDSGIIEIGSHTHNAHNPEYGGGLSDNGVNGVQRRAGESDEDFQKRVLDDIKLSYMRIFEEVTTPVSFAYPFGSNDKDADKLIEELFSFSFNTTKGRYIPERGNYKLPRYEIYQDSELDKMLK